MLSLLQKNKTSRILSKYKKVLPSIHAYVKIYSEYSDIKLRLELSKLKLKASGNLKVILPEVFALVKEATARTLGLNAYDVQLLGAMALFDGHLAEMKTGEGKTLVVVFAAVLEALSGKGVHVVTANPYLAERDCATMRPVYEALGLTVGVTLQHMSTEDKKAAYLCDITYGVNQEFGFDYLRDNLALEAAQQVQRGQAYAIVDEVDSILIDEARVPLIISGRGSSQADVFMVSAGIIRGLTPEHYILDEKQNQASFSEKGYHAVEEEFVSKKILPSPESLYLPQFSRYLLAIQACLTARLTRYKDKHYVIENDKIVLVDETTGRKQDGKRLGDGLHQALEALERVPVQEETVIQATITYQNYFRSYGRLAGLTGTALTEAEEFSAIYGLEVLPIPPNKPNQRKDLEDSIFLTEFAKYKALVADVRDRHAKQQPVLIGTASIKASEQISALLTANGLPHSLLNAKNHAKEAGIIARAGAPGAITVATNMAGRGTDILLGGDPSENKEAWAESRAVVVQAGGLAVIGAERNSSRRVDNQLRGRAGRQGDPGESKFYLSFDDELLRVFGEAKLRKIGKALGVAPDEELRSSVVSSAIAKAQKNLENRDFEYRKSLMKFDGVQAEQRAAYYEWRNSLLKEDSALLFVEDFVREWHAGVQQANFPSDTMEENWTPEQYLAELASLTNREPPEVSLDSDHLADSLAKIESWLLGLVPARIQELTDGFSRALILQVLDLHWQEHLTMMSNLQEHIHLRSFAAKNVAVEFAKEAHLHFKLMRDTLCGATLLTLFHYEPEQPKPQAVAKQRKSQGAPIMYGVRPLSKPTRMGLCPCGSGLRYKYCCGAEKKKTA